MSGNNKFSIDLDLEIKYQPLEIVDIPQLIEECTSKWQNLSLCNVNDSVIRLAVLEGEFYWHNHEKEDEFFFVIEGILLIDLEDKVVELKSNQGFTVPRGVMHRTRAPSRTSILMIEQSTTKPTGD
ncbi:MAG: cupin domain-containing protein [Candidatus Lokiarchaeota archaeon]|nr:cupin domain-containing protein [Candidatus Lokiarchaeota archaeon]